MCPGGAVYNLEVDTAHTYLIGDGIVVHNCHHSVAESYVRVLEGLGCLADDGPLLTGWTATAQRTDKLALGTVWQDITFRRGIVQMIAEGYLVDVHGQQVASDFDAGNLRTSAGDFTDKSIEAELERSDAIQAAVRGYQRFAYDEAHPDGRLAVGFTPTVASAYALAEAFTAAGIPADAVDGTTDKDERRERLRRIKAGEIRVIASCGVLNEGWDCPPISCGLLLRPTKSPVLFAQMGGRILRPFTGLIQGRRYEKPDALLLDVTGVSDDHRLCTLATLAGIGKKISDGESLLGAAEEEDEFERRKVAVGAARTKQVNLLRRGELHWIDVDGCWVLAVGKNARMILVPRGGELDDRWQVWQDAPGGDGGLRLASAAVLDLEWARGVGEEVARSSPQFARSDAHWRSKPASDRQIETLQGMRGGDLPDGKLTRGAAADLMEARFARTAIRRIRRQQAEAAAQPGAGR